jgi:ornithine cyclodeaminase
MLFDGHNGQPLAVIDAGELTARRTAAASALASSFLSRESSRHLLLVGSGRLVPHLIRTHCIVRDICKVTVCGRSVDKAEQVAEDLAESSDIEFNVCAIDNLEHAMRDADIVSLATSSSTSIINGDWLVDGQHLDLVGAYRPDMREVDDACIQRAVIFVDTLEGTLAEAGDLIQPIKAGVIEETAIVADLHALCSGTCAGRQTEDDVTLFKSVGTAIEDLAAATLLEH